MPQPDLNQMVNLTSVEVLQAYLDSFISNATINNTISNTTNTNTTDNHSTSDELSTGAIAGIAVSVIVIMVVISAVSICMFKHFKNKIRYTYIQVLHSSDL